MAENGAKVMIGLLALAGIGGAIYYFSKDKKPTWESPNKDFKINNYEVVHFTCDNPAILLADTYWIALDIENSLAYATYNLDIKFNKVGAPPADSKETIVTFTPEQIANKETTIDLTPAISAGEIVLGEKYDVLMYINEDLMAGAFIPVFKGVIDFGVITEGGVHPLCGLVP